MKRHSVIEEKSFQFAVRIVNVYKYLNKEYKEFILSKQLLRSATGIGALCREASQAESKKDFIHKLSIALKEANETKYWLELLEATKFLTELMFNSLIENCIELIKILTAIIKTSKVNYT
jgi:four helix bundle protein